MKDRKPLFIAAGLVVVIIIVVALVAGHKSNNTTTTGSSTTTSSSSSSDSSKAVATTTVAIKDYAFSPANITVKKGSTVTWTNKDAVAHTVAETDGKTGPSSQNLNQNQTYSFTYNTVGTFKYNCGIHPNMLGTVTVTE